MELIWLIKVEYVEDYKLKLFFNDNTIGIVDLRASFHGPIFEPLKEIEYFRKFKLNSWTVEWPNGADFSPEFLHSLAVQNKVELVNK
ncbi:MAG: DUF2442 domain-containing protein [Saprospiraceae bacterium]|nr:DUF2442 domain-containing protein [Saprospiraceae bacterium]